MLELYSEITVFNLFFIKFTLPYIGDGSQVICMLQKLVATRKMLGNTGIQSVPQRVLRLKGHETFM